MKAPVSPLHVRWKVFCVRNMCVKIFATMGQHRIMSSAEGERGAVEFRRRCLTLLFSRTLSPAACCGNVPPRVHLRFPYVPLSLRCARIRGLAALPTLPCTVLCGVDLCLSYLAKWKVKSLTSAKASAVRSPAGMFDCTLACGFEVPCLSPLLTSSHYFSPLLTAHQCFFTTLHYCSPLCTLLFTACAIKRPKSILCKFHYFPTTVF